MKLKAVNGQVIQSHVNGFLCVTQATVLCVVVLMAPIVTQQQAALGVVQVAFQLGIHAVQVIVHHVDQPLAIIQLDVTGILGTVNPQLIYHAVQALALLAKILKSVLVRVHVDMMEAIVSQVVVMTMIQVDPVIASTSLD